MNGNVGGSDGRELSLVRVGQAARLVTWSNAVARQGRLVKVDSKNRAIWVIPGLEPIQDLHDCCIIHAATGVRLERAKGRERPTIAATVLRLMRLSNRSENVMPCVVCTTDIATMPFVCQWCLLPFHTDCSERFKHKVCQHDVPSGSAIRRWLASLCSDSLIQLCRACRHVADSGNTFCWSRNFELEIHFEIDSNEHIRTPRRNINQCIAHTETHRTRKQTGSHHPDAEQ